MLPSTIQAQLDRIQSDIAKLQTLAFGKRFLAKFFAVNFFSMHFFK